MHTTNQFDINDAAAALPTFSEYFAVQMEIHNQQTILTY